MALSILLISILLIAPRWMFCDAAALEIRTGDRLQVNCSSKPDDWTRLQAGQALMIVNFHPSSSKYGCAGPFVAQTRSPCREGVSIDEDLARSITISSVALADAGTYTCTKSPPESTNVIVIQSDGPTIYFSRNTGPLASTLPRNNEVSAGDEINFNCSIRFSGSQFPTMELAIRDFNGVESVLTTTGGGKTPTEFVSDQLASIAYNYRISHKDRMFTVICRLPKFNTLAMVKQEIFNMVYGPIFADPQKTSVTLLSNVVTLNCSVDFYPSVSYAWFMLEGGNAITIPAKETASITVDADGDYRCTVVNTRDNMKASKEFSVVASASQPGYGKSPARGNLGAILGGVIGGAILVALVVVGVLWFLRRKKRMEDKDTEKEANENLENGTKEVIFAAPETKKHDPNNKPVEYAELMLVKKPPTEKPVDSHTEYSALKQPQGPPPESEL